MHGFDFYKKESKTVADPEIPATGGLTEYEMRQQFENFKKGYKGEIYKSKSIKREPQSVDFNESVEFIKSVMAQRERDREGASKEDRELIREDDNRLRVFVHKSCRKGLENNRKSLWSCHIYHKP